MLNNIYLVIGIVLALFTLTGMTITSFLWVNKSFRNHLEDLLKIHDKENRSWTKQLFLDYYYALDQRLSNVNMRLNIIEQKCKKEHEKNND